MDARRIAEILGWVGEHADFFDEALEEVELTDVNQLSWNGDRPLHYLARAGRDEDIAVLLDKGAYVNAAGEHGMTALHCAVMNGHLETVRLLLRWGASAAAGDEDGRTPRDWAISLGHPAIASILEKEERQEPG